MTQLFATSDTQGAVCLRDVRMAFGPLSQRHRHGVVHKYVTAIAKQGQAYMARPETSSLVFDRDGQRLALTMLHGSFGSLGTDRDSYFALGSDDFRGYVWKIPDEAYLLQCRSVVDHKVWDICPNPGEIGHDSIVNTALIHPDRPYLLTAGIERFIRLHSPTSATPSTEPLPLTPQEVRTVPPTDPNARQLLLRAMGLIDDPADEADDDSQAIALFDQILRTEGDGDVFDIRAFGPGPESSDSEDGTDVEMAAADEDEGMGH
ncbi:hypothetical protein BN946_scf184657.g18 [Trametes cinnabarina]|uniref:Uncharacterized protein n=1 Tax=Pycnoporus cinnabarinus TaxID=5643 RepID=A0A060SX85_PYCCI|nr:hypothetical protein BN946_scf184657.g18 [Trametes cinnabarina]